MSLFDRTPKTPVPAPTPCTCGTCSRCQTSIAATATRQGRLSPSGSELAGEREANAAVNYLTWIHGG